MENLREAAYFCTMNRSESSLRRWMPAILLMVFTMILSWWSCRDVDNYIEDPSAKLEFSVDTLRFDTVFTELGSATRILKVYNRHAQPIRISNIFIENGASTVFRMNVDGLPGETFQDVTIASKDSLYVFAEVTIDPDQPLSVSPFVIEDHLVFETNGNTQKVLLEAWGQNANYIPSRFNRGGLAVLTCDLQVVVWDDPKPYVIYGVLLIDSCTLRLPAGTKLYVHGGIARNDVFGIYNDGLIWVQPNGRLVFQGTKEDPVIVQGDRLEEDFQEEAGQWTGILLSKGSRGNRMDYTTVKNARFGVYVDSLADLTTRNSRFYNTLSSAIIGFRSTIKADNCLIYNTGSDAVQLLNGGNYDFTYCTIASYGTNSAALGLSNFFCYDESPLTCQIRSVHALRARFKNSILFASVEDAMKLSDIQQGADPKLFDVLMENCVVRVNKLDDTAPYTDLFDRLCKPCLNGNGRDKLFMNPSDDDYHLDSLSIAQGFAAPIPTLTFDLENNDRSADKPDPGCWEDRRQ